MENSASLLTLELLLNQRVGVEPASAAALALHHHFGKPPLNGKVSSVTAWPYHNVSLNRPATSLYNLLSDFFGSVDHTKLEHIGTLPAPIVGGLAALERYYNRSNAFFAPLRHILLSPEVVRSVTTKQFRRITGLNFPEANLVKQLASTVTILERWQMGCKPSRNDLLALDRVGAETADTLLVYLFNQPVLISDSYLRRVLYRHYVLDRETLPHFAIEHAIGAHIGTIAQAHRLHARLNEIGKLHCFANSPDCCTCPLNCFAHRM